MNEGIATACGRPAKRRSSPSQIPVRPLVKTDAEKIEVLAAKVELEKDMTQNADDFERGYQSGWNSAIVLLQAEISSRRARCGLPT